MEYFNLHANNKNNITLYEIANEWLRINTNSFKKSTYQTYSYLIKKYINDNQISSIPINNLSAKDIVLFSESLLSKKLSPKTVNNILLVVNQIAI